MKLSEYALLTPQQWLNLSQCKRHHWHIVTDETGKAAYDAQHICQEFDPESLEKAQANMPEGHWLETSENDPTDVYFCRGL